MQRSGTLHQNQNFSVSEQLSYPHRGLPVQLELGVLFAKGERAVPPRNEIWKTTAAAAAPQKTQKTQKTQNRRTITHLLIVTEGDAMISIAATALQKELVRERKRGQPEPRNRTPSAAKRRTEAADQRNRNNPRYV